MTEWIGRSSLDPLDDNISGLEAKQRDLEKRCGIKAALEKAHITRHDWYSPSEREVVKEANEELRKVYLTVDDIASRKKLIAIERTLHALRRERSAKWLAYWESVIKRDRRFIHDLKSGSVLARPLLENRFTILLVSYCLVAGGWWVLNTTGAIVGGVIAVLVGQTILRKVELTLPSSIAAAEKMLADDEETLYEAHEDANPVNRLPEVFSLEEEQSGMPPCREV